MKRLKYYLLNMKPSSESYEEVYEGKMYESFMDKDPIVHNHAVYWDGEIGYEITKSNRLELSKPTVTVHIPWKLFGEGGNLGTEVGTAALDYLYRSFLPYIRELNAGNDNRKRTYKENGHYDIYEPDNKVLTRNVVSISLIPQKYYRLVGANTIEPIDGMRDRGVPHYPAGKNCMIQPVDGIREIPACPCVSILLQVQLPEGKHKKAVQMLTRDLPDAVNCYVQEFDHEGLHRAVALYEKQQTIRAWLRENGHCAFVALGSILPREKDSDGPMQGAVPFCSTPEDEVEVAGVRGMVFRKGVTVITGGGYSGKSTLLDALSAGIYNHVEGDGREFVLTNDTAMKISAEDGRCIRHANLLPFIKWIPGGDPGDFSTDHASGSTSQAANIMEAVDWGVQLLLIDEDKSATNFMIQDACMKKLIEKEPITPFVERVQQLSRKKQVSTILVIGGSSEYLKVADRIYMMRDYEISQVTDQAKELWASYNRHGQEAEQAEELRASYSRHGREADQEEELRAGYSGHGLEADQAEELRASYSGHGLEGRYRNDQGPEHHGWRQDGEAEPVDFANNDKVDASLFSIRPEGSATEVLKVSDLGFLILGQDQVDIRMLHNIVTIPQLNAIAFLVRKLFARVNPLERYQTFSLGNGRQTGAEREREADVSGRMEAGVAEENGSNSGNGMAPRWIFRQEEVEKLLAQIEEEGLESAYSTFFTECGRWMDLPRKYELLAVLARLRI